MDALRALFQEIVFENFYEKRKKNFGFFFFYLLQLFIFSIKVISNSFFFKLSIDKFSSVNQTKKKMGLELRIRKEKKDGRFGHEDQSVSNNKRK